MGKSFDRCGNFIHRAHSNNVGPITLPNKALVALSDSVQATRDCFRALTERLCDSSPFDGLMADASNIQFTNKNPLRILRESMSRLIAILSVLGLNLILTPTRCSGTVLFEERFEDTNFKGRGWYDGNGFELSSVEHIPKSSRSAEFRDRKSVV